jgi:CheY-like chemotaxis protein
MPLEETRKTALIVDDELPMLNATSRIFYRNFDVKTAANGIEALETLKANPDIEIIHTDQKMPGKSGIEFLREAGIKPGSKTVIFNSGDATEAGLDLFEQGIIGAILDKPFPPEGKELLIKLLEEKHPDLRENIQIQLTRMALESVLGEKAFSKSLQKRKVALITAGPIEMGESLLAETPPESDKGRALAILLELIKKAGALFAATPIENSLRKQELANVISAPISLIELIKEINPKDFTKFFKDCDEIKTHLDDLEAHPEFAGGHEVHIYIERIMTLIERMQIKGANMENAEALKQKAFKTRSNATFAAIQELKKEVEALEQSAS